MSVRYSNDQLETYASALARVASLSNLFSESTTPYLNYRTTEYLYARALEADNLARSDIAIDAKRGNLGVGIKTFVYSNKPKFEKIAEFNRKHDSLKDLTNEDKIKRVAELRNERIAVAGRIANVEEYIYHCIARIPGKLLVFEVPMPLINSKNIKITSVNGGTIHFTDGNSKYKFSGSKSTLYKEFFGKDFLFEKPVVIYDDPFTLLNTLDLEEKPIVLSPKTTETEQREFVILPLYGYRDKAPFVFEKSGLNQWNAGGRDRNENEVYIPIPRDVHDKSPGFLPPRDEPFDLHFPNGEVMKVKVCQGNDKALMSQRNADLGRWLLRDILQLVPGSLATYSMLEQIGIDSVEISKLDGKYFIDFKKFGTYERYINS